MTKADNVRALRRLSEPVPDELPRELPDTPSDKLPVSHVHPEPQENEVPPADITGKEPVPLKDWDEPIVIEAMLTGQADIILDEVNELEKSPSWRAATRKRYWHELDNVPADLVEDTLAKAKLDNLKVIYETEEEEES